MIYMSGILPPYLYYPLIFVQILPHPLQSILGIKLSRKQTGLSPPYPLDLYCASSCFIFIYALL